ncbi:MAG: hypothetical protein HZC29_01800 [Thaumarchaeota archaeon]|nr:hypothetical protein [Nitrososphaerota archaeon]
MTPIYSVLAAALIVAIIATTNAYAESDSVGDLKIKTTFKFAEGNEEINSFKVFTQNSGYKWNETPSFQLWGGVGADKEILYETAEMTYERRGSGHDSDYEEFDVDISVMHNTTTLRKLAYTDCRISDYYVTTLHDNDETFSGKTKFVYADVFAFECGGYKIVPASKLNQNNGQAQKS